MQAKWEYWTSCVKGHNGNLFLVLTRHAAAKLWHNIIFQEEGSQCKPTVCAKSKSETLSFLTTEYNFTVYLI